MVHSPSKHRCIKSPSPHHLQSDSPSNEESASGQESKGSCSSSSSLSGSSSESGSGSESCKGSPARSEASAGARLVHSRSASVGSIEVLSGGEASGGDDDDASYSANEGDVSQAVCPFWISLFLMMRILANVKRMSLLVKMTLTSWRGKTKLISDGTTGLQEWLQERDNAVNDYADGGKRKPKNPDTFGPPVTYMEECGVFKPLPSTTNPLGLCQFYPMDPMIVPTLPALKLLA